MENISKRTSPLDSPERPSDESIRVSNCLSNARLASVSIEAMSFLPYCLSVPLNTSRPPAAIFIKRFDRFDNRSNFARLNEQVQKGLDPRIRRVLDWQYNCLIWRTTSLAADVYRRSNDASVEKPSNTAHSSERRISFRASSMATDVITASCLFA